MAQNKLETARELLQDRHYDAARALLETMPDDPTARKWLRQLRRQARLAPAEQQAIWPMQEAAPVTTVYVARKRSLSWGWIIGILLVVIVVGGIALVIYNQ